MSERIKDIIGDDLYNKVIEKIKPTEFDLLEGYLPRSRYNEIKSKLDVETSNSKSLSDQIEEMKKLGKNNEELKTKFTEMENNYKNQLTSHQTKLSNVTKKYKLENELLKNNAKHIDLLLNSLDLDKILIDDKENIVGLNDVVNGLKTNYKDLFVETNTNSTQVDNNTSKNNQNNDENVDWGDIAKQFI
jgi:predicted RNase H-like nuclease (RuvC/YqgF family)